MSKKYLILVLVLTLLVLEFFHSSAFAVPDRDSDVNIRVWPRFMQGDRVRPKPNSWNYYSWGDDDYAGVPTKKISKHGCLVTSLSMLFNFYGLDGIPDAEHMPLQCSDPEYAGMCSRKALFVQNDPGTLNKWLVQNRMYQHYASTGTHELIAATVAKKFYLKAPWGGNWAIRPNDSCWPENIRNRDTCSQIWWVNPAAERFLDYDLKEKRPSIMKISWTNPRTGYSSDSHFVLIGGYSWDSPNYESYRAYDPNQPYDRYKDYPPGLLELYEKKGLTHRRLRVDRYTGDWFFYNHYWKTVIEAWVFSPVEIQFISPNGEITGYDPVTEDRITEIPFTSYSEESEPSVEPDEAPKEPAKVLFLNVPSGTYILKNFGTGEGPYTIQMRIIGDNEITSLEPITGIAYTGSVETRRVQIGEGGVVTVTDDNQAPLAIAGADQTGEQSYPITLDGSGSHDPDGDPIKYSWSFVSRPAGSMALLVDSSSVAPSFTPDLPGTYIVQLVVNDYFTDSGPSIVTITATPIQSRISVTPDFSTPLTAGSGSISFDVNNIGRIGISSGLIEMTLRDPDGNLISTASKTFSLTTGGFMTTSIPVTIPSLKFGNYVLTYTQSDETRTGRPTTVNIPNSLLSAFSFDSVSYRIRDNANLSLGLINTGEFNLENVLVTLSVPGTGYINTQSINIGQSQILQYVIPIPGSTTAGQHEINVSLTLPSGSSRVQSSKLIVPESSLVIRYSGPKDISAGDVIGFTLENTGGADTSFITEQFSLKDARGVVLYEETRSGIILAGEIKNFADMRIPPHAMSGPVLFDIQIKNTRTGEIASFSKPLDLAGLASDLQTRTDKFVYFNSDEITGVSNIATGQIGIENGSLRVVVSRVKSSGTGQFEHFLPENWAPIPSSYGIAIGPDASVYVADAYNDRIQKFDGNGKLITQWGRHGDGNGQFWYPDEVAVGPDGSVYVADEYYRIQKFDSNGNFITKWSGFRAAGLSVSPDGFIFVTDSNNHRVQKVDANGQLITEWGSYGSGNGQFKIPTGIAVGPDSFVYVIDYGNFRIQKFDSAGSFIAKWGSYGTEDGQFVHPSGIAVDPNGAVYVVDRDGKNIQKFDSDGNFLSKWETRMCEYYTPYGVAGSSRPYGIAISPNGYVFVNDNGGGYGIHIFDLNGNIIGKWRSAGYCDGDFNRPNGMVIANNGSIYIADTGNNRIQKFNSLDNSFIAKWGISGTGSGNFKEPFAVTVDSSNFVYVSDTYNHRIQKFDQSGNFLAKWGGSGSANGMFQGPRGIAVDPNGNILIVDNGNQRIQKFSANGDFILAFGSYGTGDGQFTNPRSIAVSPSGFIYVADSGNYRIQKFDPDGNFISKWGSWGLNAGEFSSTPYGIAVGLDGSVFVTENGDQQWQQRIQRFDSDGNFIAKWEGYGINNGQFSRLGGIYSGSDGTLYVADTYNNRFQKMSPVEIGSEKLFESITPITQLASSIQEYVTYFGTLNAIGKLYLQAELKNSFGQTIATAEYPFYIIDGNTLLQLSADKKTYRPGETVTITGEVRNLASITASALSLQLSADSQNLLSATFDLPANGSYPFTITTTASSEGMHTLFGKVTQNSSALVEITDQYEVAGSEVTATVISPEIAGNEPFDINVEIKNEGKVEAIIQLLAINDQQIFDNQQIIVPAGETKVIQYNQQLTGDTNYMFTFTGDLEETITKAILYGLSASISLSTEAAYGEGKIAIPVTITNTGQSDISMEISYEIQPAGLTVIKTYYVPRGSDNTEILYYELLEGNYTFSANSQMPNAYAESALSVIKENNIGMSVGSGIQTSGMIPLTVNLMNTGYNEVNGNIAVSVTNNQGKVIWRGEAQVADLKTQTSGSYMIIVNVSGILPGVYKTNVVFYSVSGMQLASGETRIRVLGPIFEITSLPLNPAFTAGREASLIFGIKNTGTLEGAASFTVKAKDIIDQSVSGSFQSGEEKLLSFNFTAPEHAEEEAFNADYVLTPVNSQGSSGQVEFRISKVEVDVGRNWIRISTRKRTPLL